MRRVFERGAFCLAAGLLAVLVASSPARAQNPSPAPAQPKTQQPAPASYHNQQHESRIDQQMNQQMNQYKDQSANPEEVQLTAGQHQALANKNAASASSPASTQAPQLVPAPKPLPIVSSHGKKSQKSAQQSESNPAGGS